MHRSISTVGGRGRSFDNRLKFSFLKGLFETMYSTSVCLDIPHRFYKYDPILRSCFFRLSLSLRLYIFSLFHPLTPYPYYISISISICHQLSNFHFFLNSLCLSILNLSISPSIFLFFFPPVFIFLPATFSISTSFNPSHSLLHKHSQCHPPTHPPFVLFFSLLFPHSSL